MSNTEEEEVRCSCCGETVESVGVHVIGDDSYCPECVTCCERCDTVVPNDDVYAVASEGEDQQWCTRCTSSHSTTCYYCDTCVDDRNMAGSWNEESICEACVEGRELSWCDDCNDYHDDGCSRDNSGLHDYVYKPRPVFCNHPGALDKTSHFGLELEIEPGKNDQDDLIRAITEHQFYQPDRCYLKEDGSLDDGVELVTHPSDIKLFPWKQFRDLLKTLQKEGYTSWTGGNCGLHVHINRNLLGADCETKLSIGFSKLQPWIRIASGREDFSYCQFTESHDPEVWKYERRRAVNLQPTNTVEVRVMRGTLKPDSCVQSIKLSYNLVLWICKQSVSHLRATIPGKLWAEFEDSLSPKAIKFLRYRRVPRVTPSRDYLSSGNEDRDTLEQF